ncbi:MAG: FHA domain-containing protein [Coriobacteriaceae bacterium]|jgi:hypothetical protein|nr:FHA domain-containing protein [Coriobacteriaceae bacterium]
MKESCPVCNSEVSKDDPVCPQCGFKLLGSTQSFKPLPLTVDEFSHKQQQPATTASLRVIRGPQIEMVFALKDESYVIGRSPQREIFLNDMTVSRSHARIDRTANGYRISDLNSFNGVWINNKSIDEAMLGSGDIIQIGAFCLLYQESPQPKQLS